MGVLRVVCGKCGLGATMRLTVGGIYTTHHDEPMFARCPIVAERLKRLGKLEGEDQTECPEMKSAMAEVIARQPGHRG